MLKKVHKFVCYKHRAVLRIFVYRGILLKAFACLTIVFWSNFSLLQMASQLSTLCVLLITLTSRVSGQQKVFADISSTAAAREQQRQPGAAFDIFRERVASGGSNHNEQGRMLVHHQEISKLPIRPGLVRFSATKPDVPGNYMVADSRHKRSRGGDSNTAYAAEYEQDVCPSESNWVSKN